MATNISHVCKAYEALYTKAEAAKEAIENKATESDSDSARIEAYERFLDDLETAFDELTTELESA